MSGTNENTKKAKILIIGANGQDGKLLIEALKKKGHELICVGNPNAKNSDLNPKSLERIDLSDSKVAKKFLSERNPKIIFHLAAVHGNSINMKNEEVLRYEEMENCYLGITKNILNWQKDYSNKARSVIALSSFIFSGGANSGKIFLDSKPSPKSVYGDLKNQAWQIIRSYRENFDVHTSGLILFNHTSIASRPDFLFPTLAKKINLLRNDPELRITINLANRLIDISDARNFISGFESLIDYELPRDFIFSSGRLRSIKEIVTESVLEIDGKILERIDFVEDCTDSNAVFGDIIETEKLLKWKASSNAATILTELVTSQSNSCSRD